MSPRARATDDDEHYEEFKRQRRYERTRTVLLSCFCAGITALAIVYPVEVENNQNDRKNCVITNAIPILLSDQANQSAVGVLGKGEKGKPGYVPPFNFDGTTLKDFKPLILANAKQSARRAVQYARIVRNCNNAYPQPQFLGVDVVPGD